MPPIFQGGPLFRGGVKGATVQVATIVRNRRRDRWPAHPPVSAVKDNAVVQVEAMSSERRASEFYPGSNSRSEGTMVVGGGSGPLTRYPPSCAGRRGRGAAPLSSAGKSQSRWALRKGAYPPLVAQKRSHLLIVGSDLHVVVSSSGGGEPVRHATQSPVLFSFLFLKGKILLQAIN